MKIKAGKCFFYKKSLEFRFVSAETRIFSLERAPVFPRHQTVLGGKDVAEIQNV